MTEPNIWLTAVSTVGFPIVAFCMMFWFATKVIRENTKAFLDLEDAIQKILEKHD